MMRRIDRILYREEKTFLERLALFPLYLLSLPYGWTVHLRANLYASGFVKPKRLPCPVICVGNITAGGTGKTPLVMILAQGLMDRGISVAILSRGYKKKGKSPCVVSDGTTVFFSPVEAGDEPFLMAEGLKGVPVLVGKDRFSNGQTAIQRFSTRGLLLDDGYQHLSLHRDLDILLIDSKAGFGDGSLLPRGILREPLSHLHRAQIFLLTKVESREACQGIERKLHEIHPSAQVFHSHYEPLDLVGPGGQREDLQSFQGKRVLALSGIANPDYFFFLLDKSRMEIVKRATYPDHHWYTEKDLASIEEERKGTEWVVTTEKDMLKLKNLEIARLPVRALRIRMRIWEEEEFYRRVMEVF